jgi:fumarylpyruvate hydrolase
VHFEAELAVALGGGGRNIPVPDALSLVYGYAPALDMTRRDLQAVAKKMGRPWEVGKAFEGSAPIGPIEPVSKVGHIMAGRIRLDVNGETRQQGDLNQMIWKVPEIISYLSEYFELAAGDIILTGTPAGVGPTVKGDALRLEIEGLGVLEVDVV